jgi:zinc transport system substrate-binding protein
MKNILFSIIYSLMFFVISSCSNSTKPDDQVKEHLSKREVTVFVTIPPQKDIVQAIAGKYVHVEAMVPPGQEPHDYQPTPKQILALYSAKAYFEIGIPFEKMLVEKLKKTDVKTDFINMCKNTKMLVNYVNGKTITDPHIWLSPVQLKILCNNTLNALIKLMPQHATYFRNNYSGYIKKLNKVNFELKKILKPFEGKTFFVFHPAFGYFAKDFGLKQEAVEIEGKEPSPKELFNLISKAKRLGVKVVFVEPQFSEKSTQALADAIHGSVIAINPLSENILDNFQVIAQKIKSSFLMQNSEKFISATGKAKNPL